MSESTSVSLFASLEEVIRYHVKDFVEQVIEDEVTQLLERSRYERSGNGYRNGHRERTVTTTFGTIRLDVPRARIQTEEGTAEFRSSVLPCKSKRLSAQAEALIVACYLCGVSTRRVQLALGHALGGRVSKSTVSRCLATLRPEWEAWQMRDLSGEGIVRLVLDGISVKARTGDQVLRISVLVAMGVRADGHRVVLAIKGMGGESKEAWRELLDDMAARGLPAPQVCVIDGSKGLRAAVGELWNETLVQRCTVHKERNLMAHAPESLHEELKADYRAMMYAGTAQEAVQVRREFLGKWGSKCPKVATSLEEAGEELFTFLRFPPQQWKSLRTTNSIERLNGEFRRRIKVQGVQPGAEGVCMLFWALLSSGAVTIRKVTGWDTLDQPPKEVTLAA